MKLSPDEFAARLCAFINTDLPRLNPRMGQSPNVDTLTPLFATGIIDSLAILHLIAWVEQTTGRTIPIGEVVMKNFQTVAAITATFVPPVTKSGDTA